jgi:UDP-glucose 4-epimerase
MLQLRIMFMKNTARIMLLIVLALFCAAAVVTYPPEKEYDFIRNLKVRNIVDTNGNSIGGSGTFSGETLTLTTGGTEIPLTIQAAMGKRDQVKIYGADYPTPDGTCVRDYIHIEDLCRAHLLALKKLEQHWELAYNLGNGRGYSVREVIAAVKKVSGKDFKVTDADRRPGDPPVLTSDATKAKNELGWRPQLPDLEQIVATAWQWHSQHPDGYPD